MTGTPHMPASDRPGLHRALAIARATVASHAAKLSAVIMLAVLACALFPGLFAPQDPFDQDLSRRLMGPWFAARSLEGHPLGTDQLGRDILSRIIHGARITLLVSLFAVAVSAAVGVAAGVVAGFRGGWVDALILRAIDIQLAFPVVLLVIVAVAVTGPSLANVVVMMGLSGWPRFARIARASVLSIRQSEFIEAARAIGVGRWRTMRRHILPNISSALIVYASFELARMILLEATLSFLGLGVQPPTPTWGGMINDGRAYLHISWAVSLFPGLAIALVIFAVNMLGDELRDALDPQLADD